MTICSKIVIILFSLNCLFLAPLVSAEYYVNAESGSNQNGDGSFASPWQTIQYAADTMNVGDFCWLRAGTYRETVIPKNNQTFQAYEGEYVLVTGCDIVADWQVHEGSIYKTSMEKEVRAVFVNGNHMFKARTPDEDGDYLNDSEWVLAKVNNTSTWGTGTASVDFYRGDIDSPEGHWIGGYFIGLNGTNHFNCNMGRITSSSGTELTMTDLNFQLKRGGGVQFQGSGKSYIIGHLNALDAAKEWHWQNNSLYLWAPDGNSPATRLVEAQTRLWGFDLANSDNVTIKGINFKAASIKTGGDGMDGSTGNVIDGCTFRYHAPFGTHYYSQYFHNNGAGGEFYAAGGTVDGTSGITLTGSNNTIKNCYIGHAWGMGVRVFGNNNTVDNCFIEDVNWLTRFSMSGIRIAGADHTITNNTVQHTPGAGIRGYEIDINSTNNLIRRCNISNNVVRDYGYLMHDSETAGIYIQNHNVVGTDRWLDGIVSYNVIYGNRTNEHRVSTGIYFDNGTDSCDVHHNVIQADALKWGIFYHTAAHITNGINTWHNTIWGQFEEAVRIGGGSFANCTTQNNLTSGTGFMGNTADHNRLNVSASEFVSTDPLIFDFQIDDANSSSIDGGVVIPGFNDGYLGDAPDLGAYEYGAAAWTAGSSVVPRESWPDEDLPNAITSPAVQKPDKFELLQNYPNPFNPYTTIRFKLPVNGQVRLTVYNLLGQKVVTLTEKRFASGQHTIIWNGMDAQGIPVNSGVYVYRIETNSTEHKIVESRKMILMK